MCWRRGIGCRQDDEVPDRRPQVCSAGRPRRCAQGPTGVRFWFFDRLGACWVGWWRVAIWFADRLGGPISSHTLG